MASEKLQTKIDDAGVEGWKLKEETGENRAVVMRPNYGSKMGHLLIAVLTIWWTFGIGNLLYAGYAYYFNSEKKVLRVEEDE